MGKLFGDEPSVFETVELGRITRSGEEIALSGIDLEPIVEETNSYMDLATEHMVELGYKLDLVGSLKSSFSNSKVGSKEYLYSLEGYSDILNRLASNLGTTIHVASLEDFTNEYSVKASHEVAMEGFVNFFKKIWEKIRDFFKSFFKRISNFLKRISNSNLDLEMYEKYVVELLRRIKRDKLKCGDAITPIGSKLATYISTPESLEPSPEDILADAKLVTSNFKEVLKKKLRPALENVMTGPMSSIEAVMKRIEEYEPSQINVNVILTDINDILVSLNGLMYSLTTTDVNHGDLPYGLYEKLTGLISDSGSVSFRALQEPSRPATRLPKQFNVFTVTSQVVAEADKTEVSIGDDLQAIKSHVALGIVSHEGDYTNTVDRLLPISKPEYLSDLHDVYKDFIKLYDDIKSFDTSVSKLESKINRSLERMAGRITMKINGLRVTRIDVTSDIELFINILNGLSSSSPEELKTETDFIDLFHNEIMGSKMDKKQYAVLTKYMIKVMQSNFSPVDPDDLKDIFTFFTVPNVSKIFKNTLSRSEIGDKYRSVENLSSSMDEEEAALIGHALTLLESSMNKSFISFQQVIKSACADVVVNFTETRYAMIKYIYDSARLYG